MGVDHVCLFLQRYARLLGARRGVLAATLVNVWRLRRLAAPHGQLLGQFSHLLLRAEVVQGEAQTDLAAEQPEGQRRHEEAITSECTMRRFSQEIVDYFRPLQPAFFWLGTDLGLGHRP